MPNREAPRFLNVSNRSFEPLRVSAGEPTWARRLLHGILYGGHRLRWREEDWPTFSPQPYQQFAKVLRETGDHSGAKRNLIDMEDSRRKFWNLKLLVCRRRWVLSRDRLWVQTRIISMLGTSVCRHWFWTFFGQGGSNQPHRSRIALFSESSWARDSLRLSGIQADRLLARLLSPHREPWPE
jgi:hypothetical protein